MKHDTKFQERVDINMKRSVLQLTVIGLTIAVFALTSQPSPAVSAAADDAAALYKGKCAMCHAADGGGDTTVGKNLKVRDLRSAEVQGQTDAQLLEVIAKGKGKMPAYEKTLGADKCKDLVAFVRTLKK